MICVSPLDVEDINIASFLAIDLSVQDLEDDREIWLSLVFSVVSSNVDGCVVSLE